MASVEAAGVEKSAKISFVKCFELPLIPSYKCLINGMAPLPNNPIPPLENDDWTETVTASLPFDLVWNGRWLFPASGSVIGNSKQSKSFYPPPISIRFCAEWNMSGLVARHARLHVLDPHYHHVVGLHVCLKCYLATHATLLPPILLLAPRRLQKFCIPHPYGHATSILMSRR